MRPTPLSAYERETIIVFNDAEDPATVTTHQRRILTKVERNPAAEKIEDLPHGSQPGADTAFLPSNQHPKQEKGWDQHGITTTAARLAVVRRRFAEQFQKAEKASRSSERMR